MIKETCKPVPFNGVPEKIVIESENGGFCPPAPGQEEGTAWKDVSRWIDRALP